MRSVFFTAPVLLVFLSVTCIAQTSGYPQSQQPSMQQPLPPGSPEINPPTMSDGAPSIPIPPEMIKKAAREREAAIRNDTDRLLKLSEELKTYVDKSNENILSVDVIRKAEEIEKLAKSVREKMKGPN